MKKMPLFINLLTGFMFCIGGTAFAQSSMNKDQVMRFSKTIAYIKQYSAKSVNDQMLLENAMSGMLKGLDAHSTYLDKDSYKALGESTQGQFAGLGIEVTVENGLIKVVTPLDDSPAAKAGINPGDYIVEINQKPVRDMTLNEAVKQMRGKAGTDITLTVIRKKDKNPVKFHLTREIIKVISVKSELLADGYGYIRISQFQEKTAKNMRKALAKLEQKNHGKLNGLILDLRNNPGGLLNTAITISDLFLDSEKHNRYDDVIVSTKGRAPAANMTAKSSRGDILFGAPIIVLINEGSASASEIVSGALQDYKRAVIVGKQSFGKGSVQTVLPLDKEHAIKLTTALYYTPSGKTIQAHGIKPDIIVEDLALKKQHTDAVVLQPLREADLKGHFKNKTLGSTQKRTPNSVKSKNDYQLNQAITALKALDISNQRTANQLKKH